MGDRIKGIVGEQSVFSWGFMLAVIACVVYVNRIEARVSVHDEHLTGADKVLTQHAAFQTTISDQLDRIDRRLSRIEGRLGVHTRKD
jgi:hypothetical protein